ncbi:MAG: hypothetical protein LBM12_01575 [Candidatus Nomurabacteria bacterium]|jgi:hypothetical protein|nr:hypothetical protein [Candidatus Nomurabacteria bacterium]
MSNANKERIVQPSDYLDYNYVEPAFQSYEAQQERKTKQLRGRRLMRAARHARDYQLPEEQLTKQIREIKSRISQGEANDILKQAVPVHFNRTLARAA